MRKLSKVILGSLIACSILTPCQFIIPALNLNAKAGELETYQRKYISFFQRDIMPVNNVLQQVIQSSLPRFDYHLLGTVMDMDIIEFMTLVKKYQNEHAAELASKNEKDNIKFKDKVIPFSETKIIMNSAYIFAPVWGFSKTEISGPEKIKKDNEVYWAVKATSNLSLNMHIYKYNGDTPVDYAPIDEQWGLSKEIRVSISDSMEEKEKQKIIAETAEVQKALSTPPSAYFMDTAQDTVQTSNAFLIKKIKQLSDFILKGSLVEVDMIKDIASVGFGEKETAKTLGVQIDDGYKIVEYKTVEGTEQKVEVGFSKVRELNDKNAVTQPLIVGRDYELSDQVIEYPKTGMSAALKLGFNSLTSNIGTTVAEKNEMFTPIAYLDLEYNLGRSMDISELYATIGLGTNINILFFNKYPIIPTIVDIGIVKKFYIRQLCLDVGAKLSGVGGVMLYVAPDLKASTLVNIGYGGTVFAGASYLFNPDLLVGVDVGYKYVMGNDKWEVSETKTTLSGGPKIGSNGPIITLSANYSF